MADKSFGIKELNLIGASGTPTITSPNNLNLNAGTVAISTDLTVARHLDVDGHAEFDAVRVSGVTTLSNTVVGGATTELIVNGDARITGILTIGTSSVTINGSTNEIIVGAGFTIYGATGIVSATAFYAGGSEIGATGPQGVQGTDGAQGVQGITGAQGAQGTDGTQGIQGITGPQGTQGIIGIGSTGAQGIQGITGAGTQGIQGITGAQGAQGTDGTQGIQGITGAQGAQGTDGTQGIQGITGAQGAVGAAGTSGTRTFTVTNNGTSDYVIDGANDPTLNLLRGFTYDFDINASGHPFYFQTSSGAYNAGNVYSSGVTGNGTQVGTVTFAVPYDAPSTLYYVCQVHSGMNGTINISDVGPTGAQGVQGITGTGTGTADQIFEGNTSAEVVDTGSDGHFKVVTEGTEALRIDSSQRIGVGTSTPASSLNFGDAAANSGIQFGDSADFTIKRNIADTTIDFNVGWDLNHYQWKVGGVDYMRLDSSGRLGIGSQAPAGTLDVGAVSGNVTAGDLTVTTGSTTAAVTVGRLSSTGNDNTRFRVRNRIDTTIFDVTQGTLALGPVDNQITFSVNGSERGQFDSSGNLKFNSGYGSVATAYAARAWVNFKGNDTVSIRTNRNISSITDNGTGDYTINFSITFPDANYCLFGSAALGQSQNSDARTLSPGTNNPYTTTSAAVVSHYNGTKQDCEFIHVAVIR